MATNKLSYLPKYGLIAITLFLTFISVDSKAHKIHQWKSCRITARLIRYEVKPEFQVAFRKAISEYVLYSLSNEKNFLSEGYYEQDNPTVFWIIERWQNKRALNKFRRSIQYNALVELTKNGIIRPVEKYYLRDIEPLSKQQWRNLHSKEDNPITVMLFVDCKIGTAKYFKRIYRKAMPLFRSEPGVINYQLSQMRNDRSRFVTYEKFRNEDAFQYHLNFPPIKPVIDYLNTSIKKQPFQIGLHKLIAFASITLE